VYAARRPWVPSRAALRAWVQAVLRAAPRPRRAPAGAERPARRRSAAGARQVSIRIVGAATSRALNARYRHKPYPTNVLSFAGVGRLPDGDCDLGELVICAPVLEREARAQGISRAAHWAHITVHGVLHLLGYDHEQARAARGMERREAQILGLLGFSNPYA